jgi:small redox-active disulfide protein 2
MKYVKVLGPGCPKCKTTYQNALEAVKQLGMDVQVEKIEDLEEMFKYDVLTTPVLILDEVVKIKGRIADVAEIKQLLSAS